MIVTQPGALADDLAEGAEAVADGLA